MSRITFKAEKNYLILPISKYVSNRKLKVFSEEKLVFDFNLRLDYVNPIYYTYYKIAEFKGRQITLECDIDIEIRQTDTPMTDEYNDYPFRPYAHFTPRFGWMNDPNGLFVYTSPYTGKTSYHLFYQHNPYDWGWENMHWGHAVSDDLMNWEHLEIALYPDEMGTMFSGSAIVDYDNASGLMDGGEAPILLFYTAAGGSNAISSGKPFTQCLAYSTDGGMTFKKYEKNPVVGHICAANRDPKVIWCDELQRFVMALYLDGNEYALLVSDNLIAWEELQRVIIDNEGECPDFYPLTADNGVRKWIISGASHYYLTGDFVDGKFVSDSGSRTKRLSHGGASYAAQTFSTPDNARRIQVAWDNKAVFGDDPLCGQLGIPTELSLKFANGEYYLTADTAAEVDAAVTDTKIIESYALGEKIGLCDGAYMIELEYGKANDGGAAIEVLGNTVYMDLKENTVNAAGCSMPIPSFEAEGKLKLIVDKATAEIFSGGGASIMTVPWLADYNKKFLCITGDIEIKNLTVKKLL